MEDQKVQPTPYTLGSSTLPSLKNWVVSMSSLFVIKIMSLISEFVKREGWSGLLRRWSSSISLDRIFLSYFGNSFSMGVGREK